MVEGILKDQRSIHMSVNVSFIARIKTTRRPPSRMGRSREKG